MSVSKNSPFMRQCGDGENQLRKDEILGFTVSQIPFCFMNSQNNIFDTTKEIGYVRVSTEAQNLDWQIDALLAHGIDRDTSTKRNSPEHR